MERNLYKIHKDVMPVAPKTPGEVLKMFGMEHIMNTYGKSLDEGHIFYVDTVIEEDFSYTIFKSKGICNIIDRLPKAQRKFLLDGTFKSCPRGSYDQLLIIYLEYYNHVRFTVPNGAKIFGHLVYFFKSKLMNDSLPALTISSENRYANDHI